MTASIRQKPRRNALSLLNRTPLRGWCLLIGDCQEQDAPPELLTTLHSDWTADQRRRFNRCALRKPVRCSSPRKSSPCPPSPAHRQTRKGDRVPGSCVARQQSVPVGPDYSTLFITLRYSKSEPIVLATFAYSPASDASCWPATQSPMPVSCLAFSKSDEMVPMVASTSA